MDDFVLIHENKEYLEEVFLKIKNELENIYKLKVNPKKSFIVGSDEGVPFLGIYYKIKNDRVVSYLPNKRKVEIRKKIKRNAFLFLNHEKNIESLYSSRQCFYYGFSVSKKFLRNEVLNVEKEFLS